MEINYFGMCEDTDNVGGWLTDTALDIEKAAKEVGLNDKGCKYGLIVIDMNNGFAKAGNLYSDRVKALIPGIASLVDKFTDDGLPVIGFTDYHTFASKEFEFYPQHCIEGTEETKFVQEILDAGLDERYIFNKNSTNAFAGRDIAEFIETYRWHNCNRFIIVGCCTDICIYQAALALQTYFATNNLEKKVIIPIDLIDTFDAPGHNADFMNLVFLNSMMTNGIKIVKSIG